MPVMNTVAPLSCTLYPLGGHEPMAAAPWPAEGVTVRWLRPEDALDHDLCRSLSGLAGLPATHATWCCPVPDPALPPHSRTLVAASDGLVVGRAVLEAPYHPYCELVNLCVRPDYRRRGVATAIVAEGLRVARALGLKYMVLQTELDSPATRIYERAGFLRATRCGMQRMIHLLDAPLVGLFLADHPGAELASAPAADLGERWWRLAWTDGADSVELLLHGGSCQFDSDGSQPVVQAARWVSGDRGLAARIDAPPEVCRGAVMDGGNGALIANEPSGLRITLRNLGAHALTVAVRAMLLPHTAIVAEHALAAPQIELGPGEEAIATLAIRVEHSFPCDHQRFCSYPSVPSTAEICWEGRSVLLSAAARVR